MSLIAVGKFVYISDNRFRVLHESNSNDWILTIKSVTYKDQGIYECQITSDPEKSFKYILRVVGKYFQHSFHFYNSYHMFKSREMILSMKFQIVLRFYISLL